MLDKVSKFFRRHSFRGSSDVSYSDPVQTISFKHRRSFSKSSDDGCEPTTILEVNTSIYNSEDHRHHHRRRDPDEGPPISRSGCSNQPNWRNSFSAARRSRSRKHHQQESSECGQQSLPVSSADEATQPVYENLQLSGCYEKRSLWRVKHDHKNGRPERKLTKDSGYETSPQNESDYVNSDWINKTKGVQSAKADMIAPDGSELPDGAAELRATSAQLGYCRLQESPSPSSSKAFGPSSQYSSSDSITNQANPVGDSVASGCWMNGSNTKSTPSLHQDLECSIYRKPVDKTPALLSLATCRSTPNLDLGTASQKAPMVTRKLKKASVYEVLASKSGLDFAPMVQCRPSWERFHDQNAEELSSHIRQASNQSFVSDWASSGYHSMSIHSKQSSYSAEEESQLSFANHHCSSKDDLSMFDSPMNLAPPPPHEYFYRDVNAYSCYDCNSSLGLSNRGCSSLVISAPGRYDPHTELGSSIYSSRKSKSSNSNVQNLAAHFQLDTTESLPPQASDYRSNHTRRYVSKNHESLIQNNLNELPSWSRSVNASKSSSSPSSLAETDINPPTDSYSNSSTPLLDRLKLESKSDMSLGLHQRHGSVDSGAGSEGSCRSSQETLKWHGSNSDLTFCVVSSQPMTPATNCDRPKQYPFKEQSPTAAVWIHSSNGDSKRNSTATVCSNQGSEPYISKCESLPTLQKVVTTISSLNQNAALSEHLQARSKYNKNLHHVLSAENESIVPYKNNCFVGNQKPMGISFSQSKKFAGSKINCSSSKLLKQGAQPVSTAYLNHARRNSTGKFSNPRSPPPSQLVGNTLAVRPSCTPGESLSPEKHPSTYENLAHLSLSHSPSVYTNNRNLDQKAPVQSPPSYTCHRGSYTAPILGNHSVVHSSRVMQPQRHNSQSVMYYKSNAKSDETALVNQASRKSSVNSLPGEFETKSPDNKHSSGHCSSAKSDCFTFPHLSTSVSSSSSSSGRENPLTRLSYLDRSKKDRCPDPQLKAMQKQAVLSYFERVHASSIPSSRCDDKAPEDRADDISSQSSIPSPHIEIPQKKSKSEKPEYDDLSNHKSPKLKVPDSTISDNPPPQSSIQPCNIQTSPEVCEDTKPSVPSPSFSHSGASIFEDTPGHQQPSVPSSYSPNLPTPSSTKLMPSSEEWSRCSSPDLPLPPPPKNVLTELIENDEPLPPPPMPAVSAMRSASPGKMEMGSSPVQSITSVIRQKEGDPVLQPKDEQKVPPTEIVAKVCPVQESSQRNSPKLEENNRGDRMAHSYNPMDSPPPPLPSRNYRKLPPLHSNANKIVVPIRPQQRDLSQTCQTPEEASENHKENLHNRTMDMATQTTNSLSRKDLNTPTFMRQKRLAEIECHRLSEDLVSHINDENLSKILMPVLKLKTTADYIESLFGEKAGDETSANITEKTLKMSDSTNLFNQLKDNTSSSICSSGKPLPLDSAYYTTSESKAKFLTRYNENIMQEKSKACVDEEASFSKKKELIASLTRKLDILRCEQVAVQEEIKSTSELGKEVAARVKNLAESYEFEKFTLHVEEMGKIIKLLLSLSGRLARAENAVSVLPKGARFEEMESLMMKRDKLRSQYDEAKRLKEWIDKRSAKISKFLKNYLSEEQYKDYEHFIKMNSKLALDARDIDDKIKLGEEQLCALNKSIEKIS